MKMQTKKEIDKREQGKHMMVRKKCGQYAYKKEKKKEGESKKKTVGT